MRRADHDGDVASASRRARHDAGDLVRVAIDRAGGPGDRTRDAARRPRALADPGRRVDARAARSARRRGPDPRGHRARADGRRQGPARQPARVCRRPDGTAAEPVRRRRRRDDYLYPAGDHGAGRGRGIADIVNGAEGSPSAQRRWTVALGGVRDIAFEPSQEAAELLELSLLEAGVQSSVERDHGAEHPLLRGAPFVGDLDTLHPPIPGVGDSADASGALQAVEVTRQRGPFDPDGAGEVALASPLVLLERAQDQPGRDRAAFARQGCAEGLADGLRRTSEFPTDRGPWRLHPPSQVDRLLLISMLTI